MSRKWLLTLLAALAAPTLFAFSASAQSPITFTTAAVGTSGVTGSGSISPGATGESALNAQWQGLAPGSHHMVSQYHGTSCAAYDAAPEFVFTDVMADSQGKAAGLITVKKPFANWPNRPHFLILHATESPTSAAIACGMIVAQAVPAAASPAAPNATAPAAPAAPSAGTGIEHPGHENRGFSPAAGAGILIAVAALAAGAYRMGSRR